MQGLIVETWTFEKITSSQSAQSIIDVIDDKDSFLIVMDYIEGNPLSSALEESGAQPQNQVIAWAIQLCDVLGYLHAQSPPIIYRDMKPSNIMLKPDGNLTLIDFGTAREFRKRIWQILFVWERLDMRHRNSSAEWDRRMPEQTFIVWELRYTTW